MVINRLILISVAVYSRVPLNQNTIMHKFADMLYYPEETTGCRPMNFYDGWCQFNFLLKEKSLFLC